jgi:hypothetical protein
MAHLSFLTTTLADRWVALMLLSGERIVILRAETPVVHQQDEDSRSRILEAENQKLIRCKESEQQRRNQQLPP